MARHPRALATFALLAASGCGGFEGEVESLRVTIPSVTLAGVPGVPKLGDIEVDTGVDLPDDEGWVIKLELKSLRAAWLDPASHPDFSGIASATLTAVPGAGSDLPPAVVATYVRNPADPNPHEIVLVGDPAVNLHGYLAETVVTLRIETQGSTPSYVWTSEARIVAELGLAVEYTPY